MAKLYLRNGLIEGLHADILPLTQMGQVEVKRASTVEFEADIQEWVVRLPSGEKLFASPSRDKALEWERSYFDAALGKGLKPFGEVVPCLSAQSAGKN